MEKLPAPNTPEHVEIVQSKVDESDNKLLFEFRFARKLSVAEAEELMQDPGRMVHTIVFAKLGEKGWTSEDFPGSHTVREQFSFNPNLSKNGKVLTIVYKKGKTIG